MKFYIKSAGSGIKKDYSWQEITEAGELKEIKKEIDELKYQDLLDTESYSICLGSKNGNFILLITGMKSNRKDYRARIIRNSIVFVLPESDNEQIIRAITIEALRKNLTKDIDRAIEDDPSSKSGFRVDRQRILDMIFKIDSKIDLTKKSSQKTKNKPTIGKNSSKNIDDLIEELESSPLPTTKTYSTLIISTGIQSEDVLINEKCWRGMSDLVKSDDFVDYQKDSNHLNNIIRRCQNFNEISAGTPILSCKNGNFWRGLLVAIITILLLNIFITFFFRINNIKISLSPGEGEEPQFFIYVVGSNRDPNLSTVCGIIKYYYGEYSEKLKDEICNLEQNKEIKRKASDCSHIKAKDRITLPSQTKDGIQIRQKKYLNNQ